MGDADYGLVFQGLQKIVDETALGFLIHRRREFIQENHGGVLGQRSREGQALPLSTGKIHGLDIVLSARPNDDMLEKQNVTALSHFHGFS
jgi:hypothetical protein